ncbi:MAG TPA: hypothetical protein VMX55_01105 [candidate division Zixibacteria bacterium]|nr:hypothetical protein [candidate division Zixibacteria bacterium]
MFDVFKKKIIYLTVFLIILNLYSISMTKSATMVSTINSYPDLAPTIDGKLLLEEWENSEKVTVTIYDVNDETKTIIFDIWSLYDEAEFNFYLGVEIKSQISGFYFFIVFRTNESASLVDDSTYQELIFNAGHDMKLFSSFENDTIDGVTTNSYAGKADISVGGSFDSYGRWSKTTTSLLCEMSLPMDTGDTEGCDPNLVVGDSIDIFFVFSEDLLDLDNYYSQLKSTTGDYEYCTLKLSKTGKASLPISTVIISFGVLVITRKILKKRNI